MPSGAWTNKKGEIEFHWEGEMTNGGSLWVPKDHAENIIRALMKRPVPPREIQTEEKGSKIRALENYRDPDIDLKE